MRGLVLLLLSATSFAADIPTSPAPFPIFLKAGFSSVLEFEEAPSRVVLGDSSSFQIEKLEHSLVIRALAPYATTNMFVYFQKQDPRLFIVTASEDAEPTYYKKFETPPKITAVQKASNGISAPSRKRERASRVLSSSFDSKKDYLSVDIEITADSSALIKPNWDLVRLTYKDKSIKPFKLWSERREVQKDSTVRSRYIFAKPNVPRTLKDVVLVVPVQGESKPIRLTFVERMR